MMLLREVLILNGVTARNIKQESRRMNLFAEETQALQNVAVQCVVTKTVDEDIHEGKLDQVGLTKEAQDSNSGQQNRLALPSTNSNNGQQNTFFS